MSFTTTPATIIYLSFDEPDGVGLSDRIGTLKDLGTELGLVVPPSVDAWSGHGRDFTPGAANGLITTDDLAGASLINRNVTIRALLSIDLSADNGAMTVVCRGTDGSAAEYYAFGLELQEQAGNPGYLEARLFWQTAAGVLKTQLPGTFKHAGDNKEFMLTATRRWESSSKVVCRYYVNDQLIAEVTSADGDIGGGTTGSTSVGARKTAGAWGRYYSGVLDELEVTNYEMSAEEVAATWARLTVHQPEGVDRLRALAPPGAPWSTNPATRIGKIMKTAGHAIGFATAKADELLKNFLPDRTYLDQIGRWEDMCGLAPKAFDALDVRRQRVASFLARDNGYSLPLLKAVLEAPFNLDDSLIEILEFSNTITDDFTVLSGFRWDQTGQFSSVANALRLNVGAAANIFVDPTGVRSWCYLRTPISNATQLGGNGKIIQQAKVASITAFPADASVAGLMLWNFRTGNALWFGYAKPAANHLVVYRSFKNGVMGARVTLADLGAGGFAPIYLRLTADPITAGTFTFEWSTTSFTAGLASSQVAGLMTDAEYFGFGALGDDASLAGAIDMTFDDFTCRAPNGDRAFRWYAYRDPVQPGFGAADMIGANLLLRRLRPAHTHTAALSSKSLLCDNTNSLCDRGPMGSSLPF